MRAAQAIAITCPSTAGDELLENAVCGRVLYGAGGLGKTRLMIEVCAELSEKGWLTGFVERNLIKLYCLKA